ncbi:hypothetical protein MUK70_10785 [Dyadobacter chenwenxiniae]|nr:hypothetical protein [Dyadobacter chenwenxiniae]UON85470.1 hypothetical protein MUK70_10785 [Dyadobacter chenwenxiniae]
MTNKDKFLAGYHFTINEDLAQFEYYYDDQHDEGQGMIFHYRGENF